MLYKLDLSVQEEKRKINEVNFLYCLNQGLKWIWGRLIFKATIRLLQANLGFEDSKQF